MGLKFYLFFLEGQPGVRLRERPKSITASAVKLEKKNVLKSEYDKSLKSYPQKVSMMLPERRAMSDCEEGDSEILCFVVHLALYVHTHRTRAFVE